MKLDFLLIFFKEIYQNKIRIRIFNRVQKILCIYLKEAIFQVVEYVHNFNFQVEFAVEAFALCLVNYKMENLLFEIVFEIVNVKSGYSFDSVVNYGEQTFLLSSSSDARRCGPSSCVDLGDVVSVVCPKGLKLSNETRVGFLVQGNSIALIKNVVYQTDLEVLKSVMQIQKRHFGLKGIRSVQTVQAVRSYYQLLFLSFFVFLIYEIVNQNAEVVFVNDSQYIGIYLSEVCFLNQRVKVNLLIVYFPSGFLLQILQQFLLKMG